MSLKESLAHLKSQTIQKIPEDALKTMFKATEELGASGIVDRAPKQGDKLEDFALPDHEGSKVTLASLRAKGPVVVTFYRGGWCPYCNLQLQSYQQMLPQITDAGGTLVAITPELPDASLSTAEKNELKFEVLTDANSAYGRELGLVFTLPEEVRPIYKDFGINVESHNGDGQFDLPLAATYVVDTDGTIVFAMVDPDYTQRAEPADIVAALAALTSNSAS